MKEQNSSLPLPIKTPPLIDMISYDLKRNIYIYMLMYIHIYIYIRTTFGGCYWGVGEALLLGKELARENSGAVRGA